MNSELTHKLAQVRQLLKANDAQAVLLGRQANFAWLACGGEAHVSLNSERAVGQLLVTPKKFYVLANRIEMPRLQDEAVRGLKAESLAFDWFDDQGAVQALGKVVDPTKILSDHGDFGSRNGADLIKPLRYSLHEAEIARLRKLTRDAEIAMNLTCHGLEPGLTEHAIAGRLAEECGYLGVTAVVALIAVDDRIRKYRHPIPTTKKLKRHAMVVLCARRNGLIVSLTRLVHFGKLPKDLRSRHQAVCAVDAAFIQRTRVGTPIKEVFRLGTEAYAAQGFADEWHLHHQGGPCGYEPRDYVGTPTVAGVVLENQAFAWNPSITGTKSEDTILVTAKGPQVLTTARDWPMVEIGNGRSKLLRPDILER